MKPNSSTRSCAFRIFRMIAFFALTLIAIVLNALVFFHWQSHERETALRHAAAPTTGKFVQAGDIEVFIQEAGPADGTPVLLVHGTGAWSEIWRETMTALAANGFRAISMDVPPFGYSEKPEGRDSYSRERQADRIIGVLNALHIQRAILVGHSVGARPTVEAALKISDRVLKLVLVDPALGFAENGFGFEQNDPSWLVRTVFSIKPLRNAIVATFCTNPLFTKKLFDSFVSRTDAVTEDKVRMLGRPLPVQDLTRASADWLEFLLTAKDASLSADFSNFKSLKMPVHIVWGRTDGITPLWQGEKLRELIPNSELEIIDGVGHIPYVEDNVKFNEVLLNSLKAKANAHDPI